MTKYEATITKHPSDMIELLRYRSVRRSFGSASVMIGGVILAYLIELEIARLLLIAGIFGLIAIGAQHYYSVPRLARRVFQEQPTQAGPFTVEADHEQFTLTSDRGVFRLRWDELVRWYETPNIIAMYVNSYSAIPLRKSQMSAAMVSFLRSQLVASGLSKPNTLRRKP